MSHQKSNVVSKNNFSAGLLSRIMKLHPYVVNNQQFDAFFITRGNFNALTSTLALVCDFFGSIIIVLYYISISTNVSFHIHYPRNIRHTEGTLSVKQVKTSQKRAF